MIGRDPAARILVIFDLVRAARLGCDVSDGLTAATAVEVEGNCVEVLVVDQLPEICVTPPLEFVSQRLGTPFPLNIHPSIVAKLQLDGVGGNENGGRGRGLVARPRVSPHRADRSVIP